MSTERLYVSVHSAPRSARRCGRCSPVYYAPHSHTYYWRDNGQWREGRQLDRRYRQYARRGHGFRIELDTDWPYERHDYVIERYLNRYHRHHD